MSDMAIKYGLMKRAKKACMGDECPGCPKCKGGMMAEGGMAEDGMMNGDDDGREGLVDRIMKRFSKGGEVANETMPMADAEPAEFDDLVKDDDEESDYVDDGPGDMQEDEDRDDIVGRVMKSRKKKDRMPRPA